MHVGVISDVHGNRVALDAVLDDMPPVDHLICCGDIIGYNPWPAECVDRIRDVADTVVQGNHDRVVADPSRYAANQGAHAGLKLAQDQLSDEQFEWVTNLPPQTTALDGQIRIVHSHPENTDEYVRTGQFTEMTHYLEDGERALLMGHTHVQHAVNMSDYDSSGHIINPGSVGQPRDGNSRAAYAVIDTAGAEWSVDLQRVEYDISAVQQEIISAGLPTKTAQRLERGR